MRFVSYLFHRAGFGAVMLLVLVGVLLYAGLDIVVRHAEVTLRSFAIAFLAAFALAELAFRSGWDDAALERALERPHYGCPECTARFETTEAARHHLAVSHSGRWSGRRGGHD